MRFISLLTILFFGNFGWTQTYEIVEVEIVASTTEISNINTEGLDFAPFVSNNKIYFTSNREFDLFNIGENNWKKTGYLNVYMAEFKGEISAESKFKDVELMSENIKTNSHTGPVAFSESGDTVFFTQVVANKKKKGKNKFRPQLFMAVKNGSQWKDITALPFNDNSFSFGHPSFDSKNQRLYFSSDMDNGAGQKDIYYTDLKNGVWSTPVNLKLVNTSANELFPFSIDGFLFFASDREGGLGGLDIYWANLDQPNDAVQSIKGINSSADDFGVFIFPGIKNGYISSSKSGNDDIYFLNIEKKTTVKNELAGQFTYRNLNGVGSNLTVQIINEDDEMVYETTTDTKGEFNFKNLEFADGYTIRAIAEDDLNLVIYDKYGNPIIDLVSDENGRFSYKKIEYVSSGFPGLIPEDMVDFNLKTGHLSGQFIYENIPGKYPTNLEVKLYDEDGNVDFKTLTDANGNFDFRQLSMTENYILRIGETSDELVLLIFDKEGNVVAQLKTNSNGEFLYRKLAPQYHNELTIIEETEEVFDLNTQTISGQFEYKNLKGQMPNGLTIYAYDDDGILLAETKTNERGEFRFRSLPAGTNFLFKMDEKDPSLDLDDFTLYIYDRFGKKVAGLSRGQSGFFIYKPLGFDDGNNLSHIAEDSLDIDLALVTNFKLVTVYFDSNKSQVKSNHTSDLNKLYAVLKANPALRMEINAYADAKASDEYNLILSKERGDWIVDYMVKKGIPKSRFIVNAYGETKLIDANNDALNRRAEIRVY